ncbi:hypothetical protein CAPN004_22740 [Capnocytophaga cynodegmi]|nr:hypothetical protein CAPN004_22740 [Capnocytophaga cynodegmi]
MVNVAVERDNFAKILVKKTKNRVVFAKILDKTSFALAILVLYTIDITIKRKKVKRYAVVWHIVFLFLPHNKKMFNN